MAALYTVPTTARYQSIDGKDVRQFAAGDLIDMAEAVRFGMPGAVVEEVTSGGLNGLTVVTTRTATVDGTGTGQIATTTDVVTVVSDDANKIITLPAPVVGKWIRLRNGATGYELRTNAPASVSINGGSGANAESAIGANVRTVCGCDTATAWVCTNFSTAGVVSATEVAAP